MTWRQGGFLGDRSRVIPFRPVPAEQDYST